MKDHKAYQPAQAGTIKKKKRVVRSTIKSGFGLLNLFFYFVFMLIMMVYIVVADIVKRIFFKQVKTEI